MLRTLMITFARPLLLSAPTAATTMRSTRCVAAIALMIDKAAISAAEAPMRSHAWSLVTMPTGRALRPADMMVTGVQAERSSQRH
jgi:hypothetical protein